MKIGILTYHCVPNFGAQLQTLSTLGYMRKNSIEPILLHWYPDDLEEYYLKRVPEEQNFLQMKFAEKEMPLTRRISSYEDFCQIISELDIDGIFAGSDALFDYTPYKNTYNYSFRKLKKIPIRITSNHLLPNPFWGSYIGHLKKKIPVCGFSISSQNMPYNLLTKNEKDELGRLLNQYTYLSTRDEWTCNMVKFVTGKNNIDITPDPVFSFNNNTDYYISKDELCSKYEIPENYILISFLSPLIKDDFVNEIIQLIEKKTGFECISFPMPDKLRKFNTKYAINLPLSPLDWYFLIKYSQGYIGERMHPIIVSLHNQVPFFCFDQYGAQKCIIPRLWYKTIKESSKIYDILDKANLLSNLVFLSDLDKISPEYVVDNYLKFDKILCKKFAEQKQKEYEIGMNKVLSFYK